MDHSNKSSRNSKSVLSLGLFLGACTLSSTTTNAFLRSPPCRTPRRIRHDSDGTDNRNNHPPTSQLAFYPSDEATFAERFKRVQDVWGNVQKEGIVKFFSDEFDAAENIVKGNADGAETGAVDVVGKGESGMVETGTKLASEMVDLRQEFDELKAVKIVEEATMSVASTMVSIEKDLETVAGNVASSVEEAEEAVRTAMAAVASKEGFTPAAKMEFIDTLEDKARAAEADIKVAESVATTAKQIAAKNEQVLSQLANTGDRLSSAIDATFLAQQHKGTGAAAEAVYHIVDHASVIVKEELSAAAGIAAAVGRKGLAAADAVAAADERAAGAIAAVRAAEGALRDASRGTGEADGLSQLTAALTQDARDILREEDVAEKLVAALSQDAAADGEALGALARASSRVRALLEAVNGAVDAAADVVAAADEATADRVTAAVGKIEEVARGVDGALEEVQKARGKCEEYNVKEFMANMKAVDQEERAAKMRVGDGREKEQHIAEVNTVESPPSEIEHQQLGSVAPDEPPGDDTIRGAISLTGEGDSKHFENDAFGGDTSGELPGATTTIARTHHFDGHHFGGESDLTSSTVDRTPHAIELATHSLSSDHLSCHGDPEGFHVWLTSVGSVASDVPPSEAAHDVVTATTVTLAEAMAVVSAWLS